MNPEREPRTPHDGPGAQPASDVGVARHAYAVPWSATTAIGALAISIGVAMVGGSAVLLAGSRLFAGHDLLALVVSYQFLPLGVLISLVALVFGQRDATPEEVGFRFPGWNALAMSASTIVPVYGGVVLLYLAFNALAPGYHLSGNAKEVFGTTTHHMPIPELIGLIAFVGIEVPLTEETLFRGIVYQGLRQAAAERLASGHAVLVAALLSGLIFGAAHFQIHTFPILWFLGVVLAYVFERTRSVYASGLLHGIVNSSAALLYFLHS